MRCLDVRLRLERFLGGALDFEESQAVNDHLCLCPPCREYMLHCEMIERIEPDSEIVPGTDLADRVVSVVLPKRALKPLTKLFIGISTTAFLFAVTVFAYLRYYLSPSELAEIPNADLLASPAHWFDSLSSLAATPLLRYTLYAGGALFIAVVLIAVVDFGRGSSITPVAAVNKRYNSK